MVFITAHQNLDIKIKEGANGIEEEKGRKKCLERVWGQVWGDRVMGL